MRARQTRNVQEKYLASMLLQDLHHFLARSARKRTFLVHVLQDTQKFARNTEIYVQDNGILHT